MPHIHVIGGISDRDAPPLASAPAEPAEGASEALQAAAEAPTGRHRQVVSVPRQRTRGARPPLPGGDDLGGDAA